MLHRRPGRPRINRRRGDNEGPIAATDKQRRCSTCRGYNHNKASCQGGPTKAQRSEVNAITRAARGGRSIKARGAVRGGFTGGTSTISNGQASSTFQISQTSIRPPISSQQNHSSAPLYTQSTSWYGGTMQN